MTSNDEKDQDKPKRGPIGKFFSFFGICTSPQKGQWIFLTRRFLVIVLCLIVAVVGFGAWFTFHYSSTPEFCESCHFMEPYVESWRNSTHNMVNCYDCHVPEGAAGMMHAKAAGLIELIKTITGDFGTIPQAEIHDSACLQEGCHETRLLEGKVMFKGKYAFDHTQHLTKLRRGKKLRCTSCHSQIVQGSHLTVTESVCFTCHFKGHMQGRVLDPIAGCTSCHDAPTGPFTTSKGHTFNHKPFLERNVPCWKCHFDVVQGTGEVPKQSCRTCHGEVEKLEKYSDSEFIHDWHVTKRKVECFQCHSEITHSLHPVAPTRHAKCEVCHSAGHDAHTQMYSGVGGQGIEGEPSKHSLANVDCVACHEIPSPEHGMGRADVTTFEATEQACTECHGEAIKGTLEEWGSSIAEMLVEARAGLAEARKAYDALPATAPQRAQAQELLAAVEHNCDFVSSAFGAHNPDYAMDLLEKASEDAAEALRIANEAKKTLKNSTRRQ